jgi:hypothetical protein
MDAFSQFTTYFERLLNNVSVTKKIAYEIVLGEISYIVWTFTYVHIFLFPILKY